MSDLTAKQLLFAQLVADLERPRSLSDAYREAYETDGMDERTVNRKASETAALPGVRARISNLKQEQFDSFMFKQIDVLRDWVAIATADPTELIRSRRWCCRHCYGEGHAYEWAGEREFAAALDEVMMSNDMRRRGSIPRALPSCDGGFGYVRNRLPVKDCPVCHGDGTLDVYISTPEEWSPEARKLYAGIKQTKDGIQVLMRDQDGAMKNIAQFLGMLVTKSEVSGPGGAPIQTTSTTIIGELPADEAMKLYTATMG